MLTLLFFIASTAIDVWIALIVGIPSTLAAIFAFFNGRRQKRAEVPDLTYLTENFREGVEEHRKVLNALEAIRKELVGNSDDHEEFRSTLEKVTKELNFNGDGSLKDMVKAIKGNQEYLAYEISNLKMMADHIVKDSLGKLRIMFASSPIGYFETDHEGNCTYVNAAWTAITGLSLEHSSGRGWLDALHPQDRLDIEREWQVAVQEGRQFGPMDYRFLKDDVPKYVRGIANPIFDSEKKLSGWVGTIVPK